MTLPGIFLALQMSAEHDEQLARRLQRRDPEAMEDLYDRFGRLAYSVIVAIVRDNAVGRRSASGNISARVESHARFEPGRARWGRGCSPSRATARSTRLALATMRIVARCDPSLFVDMERDVLNADHARVIRAAISKLTRISGR